MSNLPPPITVSDNAIKRISYLLDKRGKPSAGVRVGVKKGGCSGLAYTIEYSDSIESFDEVVKVKDLENGQDLNIIIDPKAIIYLIGSQMDYVEEKLKAGFIFSNPNEKGTCGCGESFHV